MLNRLVVGAALALAVATLTTHGVDAQDRQDSLQHAGLGTPIRPTTHPPLPVHAAQYWLVPDVATSAGAAARPDANDLFRGFARGVSLIGTHQFGAALPLVSAPGLSRTILAAYAQYYRGLALIGLSQPSEADAAFRAAAAMKPDGYLRESLALQQAQIAQDASDPAHAYEVLAALTHEKLSAPEEVWAPLGRAAELAGRRAEALEAYRRVYYDFPLSLQANDAQAGLERLQTTGSLPPDHFERAMARAETLFGAKRWAQARAGFESIASASQGDDAVLVKLRLAECDYYLDRFRQAREDLAPLLDTGPRRAEARFFHLTATRALGQVDTYERLAREFVQEAGDDTWAAEALNNLGTHYILANDDASADRVFRDLLARFPESRHAERAAWKAGWRAYREGTLRDAAEIFEQAAARYPRADYRPSWLYWSGRARERLGDAPAAIARYRVTVADYQNSYYGRLAEERLAEQPAVPAADGPRRVRVAHAPTASVPTDALIRQLVALELYDDALREVQYAQRVWGDSAPLQATVAFVRHNQGLGLQATDRFNALRGAITTMRRAYPQFMAAGGEDLPPDVLRIIFPLDFWPLITKYSRQHDLDPYLVAALMAQESTFTPEITSSANAIGLMQLVPAAGRQYARKLGIANFRTSMLTNPEVNVRLGTQYFKDLSDRFGGAYYALASYNAGPNRVAQWKTERGDLPQDEFIDDIPFPETQTYVKRILGTAEDYRRLYGGGLLDPNASDTLAAGAAPAVRAPSVAKPAVKKTVKKPAKAAVKKPATKKASKTPARRRR